MTGRDRYKVDTWYEAPSRKGRKNNADVGSKVNGPVATKFFVSNIPEGCTSAVLNDVFKGFGNLIGTYIARKYDKLGKRFGFVSFANVKDPITLEKDLKDVWIGSYKLFIVLARFVDGEKVTWKEDKKWVPVAGKNNEARVKKDVHVTVENQPASALFEGRSFRDTLVGKEKGDDMVHVVLDDEVIGNVFWNGLGLLGTTKDLQALTSLKDWLRSVRLPNIRIRYVGGLSVILVFEDKEGMMDFLSTKEVWNPVLSTLVVWEGQRLPCDRIAWLKILGLPLCLFDSTVVDKIGSMFGRVVQSAQVNEDLEDYSYAMVGVLCNSIKRFNQVCNVKWRNEVIAILVEEELGEWIPDCIGMDGEESLDDLRPQKMTVDSLGDKECLNEEAQLSFLFTRLNYGLVRIEWGCVGMKIFLSGVSGFP
ncbi:uncharacterized protein LOC110892344 [Helianthus annuus]|uniref:uncharacterized protein LOC110892344 n=1 Tax=Helianthus annuus TaxID=4232 RepID=UPI000B905055|nr:uncharacterized protein LOC110892344 [Helianthus annuus]